MPEEIYGFGAADITRLKRAVEFIERSFLPPPTNSKRRPLYPARTIIGALTSPASATTALLGKPKTAVLNVYTFSSTGVEDTGVDETVYNFQPQACSTDHWTMAERDDFTGKFVITRQFLRRRLKGKTTGIISAGGSGTVNIWLNGVVTSPVQTVTAHLNWMANGNSVAANTEVIVEWFQDEDSAAGRWVITSAAC